ncbi:MAG TPA: hypothetical protein VFB45_25255 [Pseudolabrys sp.]|nr:hypothetical protein [Pseudolabrys sp.]
MTRRLREYYRYLLEDSAKDAAQLLEAVVAKLDAPQTSDAEVR